MHLHAWLLSTCRPSCCGNVMETPESFQSQGAMATMQQLAAASICRRSRAKPANVGGDQTSRHISFYFRIFAAANPPEVVMDDANCACSE